MIPLSARTKIGQRLVSAFPGTTITEEFIRMVKQYKIANVLLHRDNIENDEQLCRLCQSIQDLVLQETGHAALIAVNQEGGTASQLAGVSLNVPAAMAIAATNDPQNAFLAGYLTGTELCALGINLNLAPCADINTNPQNSVIGVRSFGDDPQQVSEYVAQSIAGMMAGGIMPAAKHFPGHGAVEGDSIGTIKQIAQPRKKLEENEFAPFRAAIAAHVPAIMVTHTAYPALDNSGAPATLSRPILTNVLRKKLGFHGLIISDCMELPGIQNSCGTIPGILAAMRAGADLVCICKDTLLVEKAAAAIYQALENKELSAREMNDSVTRIITARRNLVRVVPALRDAAQDEEKNRRILQKAITEVQVPIDGIPSPGSAPLCLECRAAPAMPENTAPGRETEHGFAARMAKELGGEMLLLSIEPTESEIAAAVEKARQATSVILGTCNGHLHPPQRELLLRLAALGKPMAAIALQNPYDLADLPPQVYALAVYEASERTACAAAGVLLKKVKATGVLPVKLKA